MFTGLEAKRETWVNRARPWEKGERKIVGTDEALKVNALRKEKDKALEKLLLLY